MDTIDIRDSRLKGDELKIHIIDMVKSTQFTANRLLPDKIKMTKNQFQMLSGDMLNAYNPDGSLVKSSTERIYMTPLNAMNVEVK